MTTMARMDFAGDLGPVAPSDQLAAFTPPAVSMRLLSFLSPGAAVR